MNLIMFTASAATGFRRAAGFGLGAARLGLGAAMFGFGATGFGFGATSATVAVMTISTAVTVAMTVAMTIAMTVAMTVSTSARFLAGVTFRFKTAFAVHIGATRFTTSVGHYIIRYIFSHPRFLM
jgi:hypothetical protein